MTDIEYLLNELVECSRVLPHEFTPQVMQRALAAFSSLRSAMIGLSEQDIHNTEYTAIACMDRVFDHYKDYTLGKNAIYEHNYIGM